MHMGQGTWDRGRFSVPGLSHERCSHWHYTRTRSLFQPFRRAGGDQPPAREFLGSPRRQVGSAGAQRLRGEKRWTGGPSVTARRATARAERSGGRPYGHVPRFCRSAEHCSAYLAALFCRAMLGAAVLCSASKHPAGMCPRGAALRVQLRRIRWDTGNRPSSPGLSMRFCTDINLQKAPPPTCSEFNSFFKYTRSPAYIRIQ